MSFNEFLIVNISSFVSALFNDCFTTQTVTPETCDPADYLRGNLKLVLRQIEKSLFNMESEDGNCWEAADLNSRQPK